MKIFFSKYWRKRSFAVVPAAVLAVSLATTLLHPGCLRKQGGTETPKSDLLMEQLINNRVALPALHGNPEAISVMAEICRNIENDPAAGMQYIRYGAVLPTADVKLLENAVAAAGGFSGRQSSPELRMFMRRLAAVARFAGNNDLPAKIEMYLKYSRGSLPLPQEML